MNMKYKIEKNYIENVKQRILSKIKISENGCWEWIGAITKLGYGHIGIRQKGKSSVLLAHRTSYSVFKEFPKDKFVLHKCNNRTCCNPDHLYFGTQSDNMKDRTKDGNHSVGNRKGENHPRAKLKENEVIKIRKEYKNGKRICELSKEFNIKYYIIDSIVKRKTWRHVTC